MTKIAVMLALLTAFSMAAGQLLFKLGAARWHGPGLTQWVWSFISNPQLVGAVFLYAITILVWIYVLRVLPLSVAYPLTALSYVIVPVLSLLFLQERISMQTVLGSVLIIAGVVVANVNRG